MKTRGNQNSLTACLVAMSILYVISPPLSAGAWGWPWGDEPCGATCPACQHVCKFSLKKVDEKKHRYVADTKVVCIPRVVFPWQTDDCYRGENNGARLRRVSVLKREYYTCPHCEYSWSAEKRGAAGKADIHADKKSIVETLSPPIPRVSPVADRSNSVR